MKDEKVYIEGYVVGFLSGTDGTREKKIQVASGEIVSIDENFIYKSIEPQKVVVPQFVADWIKVAKKASYNIRGAIDLAPKGKVKDWLELKNVNIFAEAWVNGYEVEKEKRYIVKVKGVYLNSCLVFDKGNKKWFFSSMYETEHQIGHHTRKQLETDGFGWVFDCEGIEIEEVQE